MNNGESFPDTWFAPPVTQKERRGPIICIPITRPCNQAGDHVLGPVTLKPAHVVDLSVGFEALEERMVGVLVLTLLGVLRDGVDPSEATEKDFEPTNVDLTQIVGPSRAFFIIYPGDQKATMYIETQPKTVAVAGRVYSVGFQWQFRSKIPPSEVNTFFVDMR